MSSNFFHEICSNKSADPYYSYDIHSLIDDILNNIKDFLKDHYIFFPALVKISLECDGFINDIPKELIKINIPRKKCFRIWDIEMLDKALMKIHTHLLNFESNLTCPYNLTLNSIKGFKIKFRNLLTFEKASQKYLYEYIKQFQGLLQSRMEINSNDMEENQIVRINRILHPLTKKNLQKTILIYMIETDMVEDGNMNSYKNYIEKSVEIKLLCIGPLHIIQGDTKIFEILYFDSLTNKLIDENEKNDRNIIISKFICVYCFRQIAFDDNLGSHYSVCKERAMKDSREKKMKDDLINDVNVFKRLNEKEIFVCKKDHLKAYKQIRKPRSNLIKNERRNKKLVDFIPKTCNNLDVDLTNSSINSYEKEKKSKKFNNYNPVWSKMKEEEKDYVTRNLYPKNNDCKDINDYAYKRVTETLCEPLRGSENSKNLDRLYDQFVHNSPMFTMRNETFVRSKFEKATEFICEYKATKDLYRECSFFPMINLMDKFDFAEINLEERSPSKTVELLERIKNVVKEEKKTPFSKRYSYFNLKYNGKSEKKNPYDFYGIIKCDLEYSGNKSEFLKKKFPVLPNNNYIEFRDNIYENMRCQFKMKKNTFDDLNGYSIFSPLLFYLLENDIIEIKRIESYCKFSEGLSMYNLIIKPSDEKIYNGFVRNKNGIDLKFKEELLNNYLDSLRNVFLQNLYRKDFKKENECDNFDLDSQLKELSDNYYFNNDKKSEENPQIHNSIKNIKNEQENLNFNKDYMNIKRNQENDDVYNSNFIKIKRIMDFKKNSFKISQPKSLELKVFKIFTFIFMSILNLKNIDTVLGYLLNPKNINNIVLNNSDKKTENNPDELKQMNGQSSVEPQKKKILITKFSIMHLSFERIIIKYACISSEIKREKVQQLINCKKNPVKNYVFSNIINDYYFMRPYFFYRNYKENENITSMNPEFIKFNAENFHRCLNHEMCPLNHCKYSIINLPFKLFSDCRYFNKLIFDEGYSSKNDRIIELMFHNLENRFKGENPNFMKNFKDIFNCSRHDFKIYIMKSLPAGFNLDTYGIKWNLDHIIPLNAVKENKATNEEIWKYTNIKPLSIIENVKKGGTYNGSSDINVKSELVLGKK